MRYTCLFDTALHLHYSHAIVFLFTKGSFTTSTNVVAKASVSDLRICNIEFLLRASRLTTLPLPCDMYVHPLINLSGEAPEDADFSGIQTKIGAAKKVEMRERLKSYLETRLSDSASEFMGAMQQEESEDMEMKREEVVGDKKLFRTKKVKLESTNKDKVPANEINRNIVSEWGQWQALIDSKRGQIFYYNKKSQESSWERPDGFPSFKLSASKRIALAEQNKLYLEWHEDDDIKFNGEIEEPKAMTNSNKLSKPAAETKSNLSAGNYFFEESNNEGSSSIAKKTPDTNQLSALPIVQQGDWSAYFDTKSGVVFYYEETSGKTSWDPPFKDFPRIVMDSTGPRALDSGSTGNISMERALGYIGVDEMAEALAWEEAKAKEKARKAAKRAKEADKAKVEEAKVSVEPEREAVEMMYEAAKKAELERIEQERKFVEEQKAKEEAAAKLAEQESEQLTQEQSAAEKSAAAEEKEAAAKLATREKFEQERLVKELEQKRTAAELTAAKEREASANRAIEEKLNQERLEKERLEADKRKQSEVEFKQPVRPKEDPIFTVLAPVKTNNLYDILQCSSTASRPELKRAYLSLAKVTHPDALLQNGIANSEETELRFVEISQAWKILGDTTSRRRYDRELQAKGISSKAGNMFESWVMGAAKVMDEALAKAENDLDGKKP